jgi:hypothetical protein
VRPTHSQGVADTIAIRSDPNSVNTLARSRTWSATFGGSRAYPAHSKGFSPKLDISKMLWRFHAFYKSDDSIRFATVFPDFGDWFGDYLTLIRPQGFA